MSDEDTAALRAELERMRAERDAARAAVAAKETQPRAEDLPTLVATLECARTEAHPQAYPAAREALDRLTVDHKRRSRAVAVLEAFFDGTLHPDGTRLAAHAEAMAALALLRGAPT